MCDDLYIVILEMRNEEWLKLNPEYSQSPYWTDIAAYYGQLSLFDGNGEPCV